MTRENINTRGWSRVRFPSLFSWPIEHWTQAAPDLSSKVFTLQFLQHPIQLLLQIWNLFQYRRLSRLYINECPWINFPKEKKLDEQHPKKCRTSAVGNTRTNSSNDTFEISNPWQFGSSTLGFLFSAEFSASSSPPRSQHSTHLFLYSLFEEDS